MRTKGGVRGRDATRWHDACGSEARRLGLVGRLPAIPEVASVRKEVSTAGCAEFVASAPGANLPQSVGRRCRLRYRHIHAECRCCLVDGLASCRADLRRAHINQNVAIRMAAVSGTPGAIGLPSAGARLLVMVFFDQFPFTKSTLKLTALATLLTYSFNVALSHWRLCSQPESTTAQICVVDPCRSEVALYSGRRELRLDFARLRTKVFRSHTIAATDQHRDSGSVGSGYGETRQRSIDKSGQLFTACIRRPPSAADSVHCRGAVQLHFLPARQSASSSVETTGIRTGA